MNLSKVQQEAVDFYKGSCNVIASAGSGKTRVLVNRIVKLIEDRGVEPQNILAITFSKKAKENMYERLSKMVPGYVKYINIETFHSFGFRIIRKFSKVDYEILDVDWKKVRIVEEILQRFFRENKPDGQDVADLISYISVQKNQMKKPTGASRAEKVYRQYEFYKSQHKLIDFDDMLTKCYEILDTNEDALQFCQDKFKFILADEMQDTNAAQYAILSLIAEKHHNVFIVDDPLQNIFMWRGSDNKFVMNFDRDWPDARIIHLNKNYRSSEDIVAAANHFAKCIPESKHRNYVESIADKDYFQKPHYSSYADELSEADAIANKIKDYVEAGYKYRDIAILTRTNAQLQNFENSMYHNEIPYTIVDGMSFIDRKEIKIILCYLRLACNINDDEAFEYIYNRPNRYVGRNFLQEIKRVARRDKISLYCAMFKADTGKRSAVNSIYTAINSISEQEFDTVAEMIKKLREVLELDSYVAKDLCENDDSRIENLNALERTAKKYTDANKFISYMTRLSKTKKDNPNSVQLMTIHKSKGLEFPIVFVAGVNQGVLPHEKNKNPDEEKRLMYVAITRAEKILHISSTKRYNDKEATESEFVSYLFK